MNVIICEADPASAEALRQAVAAWVCGRQLEHAVSVTVFHSSEDLMERFEAGLRMDALLTGLQFQHEESGLRAAREIHRLDPNLPVVLISNSAEYVYEGYAVSALRFLKKPVSQQDIDECMELVWRRYMLSRRDSVLIETRAQTLRLPADSILSIEALGHNVQIKTTDEVGGVHPAQALSRNPAAPAAGRLRALPPQLHRPSPLRPPLHAPERPSVQRRPHPHRPHLPRRIPPPLPRLVPRGRRLPPPFMTREPPFMPKG